MFTKEDFRELVEFEALTPFLSVYLNVDPTEYTTDEYKLALRQMLKGVDSQAAPEDVAAVESFFDHEYDWDGRGVAVFSGVRDDFWHTYSFAVPVTSAVVVARKAYVGPLAALLDAYGSYAVALIGRQDLRLELIELGEVRLAEKHEGEEVHKLKKGRGSSGGAGRRGGAPISSRHEEEVVQRNLRSAAKTTERFFRQHAPQHLVLAGSDGTVAAFFDLLPKAIQDKVVGTFVADLDASESEVRDRSVAVVRRVEAQQEQDLVDRVFTAAAKGRGGAIRLADTLGAAHEGRIQTLVIARHYHEAGYRCQNCSYITDHALDVCPFCGGEIAEIADAAEALVTKVIEDGGKVAVIDEELYPAIRQFGVGALLRY